MGEKVVIFIESVVVLRQDGDIVVISVSLIFIMSNFSLIIIFMPSSKSFELRSHNSSVVVLHRRL